jgi:putative FmdB family regulatory protein
MPLYEYSCRVCAHQFETLVRGCTTPTCPACTSEDLERLFSMPVVRSETTRDIVSRDAKQRDARQASERVHAQREYERNHD